MRRRLKTAKALFQFGGIKLTPGGVVQAVARATRVLEPTYGALIDAVRASDTITQDDDLPRRRQTQPRVPARVKPKTRLGPTHTKQRGALFGRVALCARATAGWAMAGLERCLRLGVGVVASARGGKVSCLGGVCRRAPRRALGLELLGSPPGHAIASRVRSRSPASRVATVLSIVALLWHHMT